MLVALYAIFVIIVAFVRPKWVPALPAEARIYREPNGSSGHNSLFVLLGISGLAGVLWSRVHQAVINPMIERELAAPTDEILIMSMTVASFVALALALTNRLLKLGLLSRLSEQVTFVLIPPLVLIFLVLGTIFLGVATPTEGGAMGAVGALIMALSRRRLTWSLLRQALDNTTKLSCFVMFILIGSHRLQLYVQRCRRPLLGRSAVRERAGRRARLSDRRQYPGFRPWLLHRLLRDRLHRDSAAGAGG